MEEIKLQIQNFLMNTLCYQSNEENTIVFSGGGVGACQLTRVKNDLFTIYIIWYLVDHSSEISFILEDEKMVMYAEERFKEHDIQFKKEHL